MNNQITCILLNAILSGLIVYTIGTAFLMRLKNKKIKILESMVSNYKEMESIYKRKIEMLKRQNQM